MISIVTPIFNGRKYLPDTVESVLAQTSTDWEWLLVDDGSTDDTLNYCLKLAHQDSRIRVLSHADRANLGQGASRNLALRHASGEILAFLDADDLWIPEKLARDIATFARHPRAMILYSRTLSWRDLTTEPAVSSANQPGYLGIATDSPLEAPEVLLHVIRKLYDFRCQFPDPSCLVIRRAGLPEDEELFDPALRYFEDVVPLTKLLLCHPAVIEEDIRTVRRMHRESVTAGLDRREFDAHFDRIVTWITSYVAESSKASLEAVRSAVADCLRRKKRHRRKMAILSAARRALPLNFREWIWRRYGKQGLV